MQVVILAGGRGSRLSEETDVIPKPMLMVGDKPLLHHIMDIFMKYGHNDFIVAAGYKKEQIYAYFLGLQRGNIRIGTSQDGRATFYFDEFSVSVVDTGTDSQTGGRLKRLSSYIKGDFFMTYGDGLANIDVEQLVRFHSIGQHLATITAVSPVPRFGEMKINDIDIVTEFGEKPTQSILRPAGWINGGFFVLKPEILNMIPSDDTNFEKDTLPEIVKERKLIAYTHTGFWQCVDTLRDLQEIRKIYKDKGAKWLVNS